MFFILDLINLYDKVISPKIAKTFPICERLANEWKFGIEKLLI